MSTVHLSLECMVVCVDRIQYCIVRCTDVYTGTFCTDLCTRRRRPRRPSSRRRRDVAASLRAMFLSLSMRASAFTTSSLTMGSSSKYSKGATRRRACVTPRARLDAGVGAFGSKAGMTQVFTEDGLCVPVTVIAVREGNVVTQVRIRGNFFCVCARARGRVGVARPDGGFIHSFARASGG